MYEHQKLVVYGKAVEVVAELHLVARQLSPELYHQLTRASTSIVLNLAEGAGEFRPAEKARFYRMARRSAAECDAVLDLADRISPPQVHAPMRERLAQIGAMLTNLIKSQQ